MQIVKSFGARSQLSLVEQTITQLPHFELLAQCWTACLSAAWFFTAAIFYWKIAPGIKMNFKSQFFFISCVIDIYSFNSKITSLFAILCVRNPAAPSVKGRPRKRINKVMNTYRTETPRHVCKTRAINYTDKRNNNANKKVKNRPSIELTRKTSQRTENTPNYSFRHWLENARWKRIFSGSSSSQPAFHATSSPRGYHSGRDFFVD